MGTNCVVFFYIENNQQNTYEKNVKFSAAIDAEQVLSALISLHSAGRLDNQQVAIALDLLYKISYRSRIPSNFKEKSRQIEESHCCDSNELIKSLERYRQEARYTTINHIKSLTKYLSHRRLWIHGDPGTGKKCFAAEAAYRALRAGSRTLIVHSSRSSKRKIQHILQNVDQNLTLYSHRQLAKFMSAQWPSFNGYDNPQPSRNNKANPTKTHQHHCYWDLVIIDDWDQLSQKNDVSLEIIEQLSYKILVLSSSNHTSYKTPKKLNTTSTPTTHFRPRNINANTTVTSECYYLISLTDNIRSTRSVANYLSSLSNTPITSGISENGQVLEITTHKRSLVNRLLLLIEESLRTYSPSQILIIVDPDVVDPDIAVTTPVFTLNATDLSRNAGTEKMASSLASALALAADNASTRRSIDYDEQFELSLEHSNSEVQPTLLATNGRQVKTFRLRMNHFARAESLAIHGNVHCQTDVDASKLLNSFSLSDPKNKNAILILQKYLATGMEAELVIYIRNDTDANAMQTGKSESSNESMSPRTRSHLVPMSCATHQLIDLRVQ